MRYHNIIHKIKTKEIELVKLQYIPNKIHPTIVENIQYFIWQNYFLPVNLLEIWNPFWIPFESCEWIIPLRIIRSSDANITEIALSLIHSSDANITEIAQVGSSCCADITTLYWKDIRAYGHAMELWYHWLWSLVVISNINIIFCWPCCGNCVLGTFDGGYPRNKSLSCALDFGRPLSFSLLVAWNILTVLLHNFW